MTGAEHGRGRAPADGGPTVHALRRTLTTSLRRRPSGGRSARPGLTPFLVLIGVLLGGGLVSLLLLNTSISAASFEMQRLQASQTSLTQTEQQLQQQIDARSNPSALASAAAQLGMVPAPNPAFLDPRTGRVLGSPAAGVSPTPTPVPTVTLPVTPPPGSSPRQPPVATPIPTSTVAPPSRSAQPAARATP